jgi:hypothetical protein
MKKIKKKMNGVKLFHNYKIEKYWTGLTQLTPFSPSPNVVPFPLT